MLARALQPDPDGHTEVWNIDGTLIPVHDHTITAVSKNYRRSINTKIIISSTTRGVVSVGSCWPGNRNDVVVARATVAHLTGRPEIPARHGIYHHCDDDRGWIIRDDRYRVHRRIRARVEHVIARLKDWQILRQCRRPRHAINHNLQIIAGLWNLKTLRQLRVNS